MADDNSLDGALFEAFGGDEGESVVARLSRLSGVQSRILLHDARGDESPLLRMPASVPDQGAANDSRYQIVGEIARGGVGVVYKARDKDLGRDVALKVLRREHAGRPEVLERLVEEAQIGGQLQHPGIVPVYGMGLQPDGRPYLAMKLIKGRTLGAVLKASADPSHERVRLLRVFEQICQTMAYAHTRGVIHRDLKPSNVMVGGFGEVQIVDWGFGKVLGHDDPMAERLKERTIVATVRSAGEGSESLVGSVMGTPAYMPPEQALGQIDELDERSDVFALGAILCQILTGKPPYVGEAKDLLTMAAQARLEDAQARLDGCGADPAMVALCRQALSPLRAERPKTAAELAEALETHFAQAEERAREAEVRGVREAARLTRERQAAAWARRSKRKTAALAVVVVLAMALAGGGWLIAGAQRRDRIGTLRADARGVLDEAARLHGARRWREAAAKAGSARDLAAQSDDLAALRDEAEALATRSDAEAERVERREKLLRDLSEAAIVGVDAFGRGATNRAYQEALRAAGLELQGEGVEALSKTILAAFPEAAVEIAAAFDTWMWRTGEDLPAEVARRIDDDPWRTRLRDAVKAQDATALKQLQAEAADKDLPLETQHLLGHALGVSGQREAALAHFDDLRAKRPDDFLAHVGALRWSHDSPDAAAAAARATAAVALRPDSPAALNNLGNSLLAIDDLEGAEAVLRRALNHKPGFLLAHNNLGRALHRQGDLDGAMAAFKDAIRIDAGYARSHSHLGIVLSAQGKHKEACDAVRVAIRLEPDDAGYHNNLSLFLAAAGDIEGAIAALHEAVRLKPDFWSAYVDLGGYLLTQGDVEGSIAASRKANRLKPDYAGAHKNLGQALLRKSDLDGAIDSLREAIRLDPDYTDAHMDLGNALRSKGDVSEAVASYREAVRLAPEQATAHYNLGNGLLRLGGIDTAIASFRKTLELDPEYAEAHCNLGSALWRKGDYTKALEHYEKGHSVGSRRSDWHYPSAEWVTKARWLVSLGERLPKFVSGKETPRDAKERAVIAEMLYRKRRYSDAATWYAELVRQQPESAALRYNAACSAVLAATPAWRVRALAWLRADLKVGRPRNELLHWRRDPDFKAVREKINELPVAERADWRRLWREVDARLRDMEGK